MAALPPEFRAEPVLALAGGNDGMDVVRPLLRGAAAHLNEGGALVLEIGHERAHLEAAFPALAAPGGLEVVWLPCSAGDDQVLLLARTALAALAREATA
jgi:ribosomal protein L3 glutamine methyltransferase